MTNTTSGKRASQRAFFRVSALLFVASAALTAIWAESMSAMGGMTMPGGWTMSMAWMRMPGQTWAGLGASFVGMWLVMMMAMMLPSLVPMLWRYREAVARTATTASTANAETRLGRLTAIVAGGYFFIWIVLGIAAFAVGVVLTRIEMQQEAVSRAVPIAVGVIVLMAGALQFTSWKAHHLACCRHEPAPGSVLAANARTAWWHGLRLGLHCSSSSAGATVVLLAIGVMDLRAMAIVAAVITAERLAPAGERTARAIGALVVIAGLVLITQACPPGTPAPPSRTQSHADRTPAHDHRSAPPTDATAGSPRAGRMPATPDIAGRDRRTRSMSPPQSCRDMAA